MDAGKPQEFFQLERMPLRQLRQIAERLGIPSYTRLRREDLIIAIVEIQHTRGIPAMLWQELEPQDVVIEAAKFDVGQEEPIELDLSDVDAGLTDLPDGYGESRIVLLPRDPQWAYVYWDVPNEHKEILRREGGQQLTLRLYDVTDLDLAYQAPHTVQEYGCDELARDWYLPIPVSDRDYCVEIGYRTGDGRWLVLARSAAMRVPPVYPSDWIEDHFLTIDWNEDLRGKQFLELVPPSHRGTDPELYGQMFALSQAGAAQRIAGSLFGSMQQVPGSMPPGSAQMWAEQAVSSFVFPSGMGLWASGMGLSGMGFSASVPPLRSRKFWLVANAELIVYGATEPDATVYAQGVPITLNADGTFRFQMVFEDGTIDYPIFAVATDGEQTRHIHLKFERQTLDRRTNTQEEAIEEIQEF